jgi:hypothetical protein
MIKSSTSILLSILLVTSMLTFVSIHALSSNVIATPEASKNLSMDIHPYATKGTITINPTDDGGVSFGDYENTYYGTVYNMYNGYHPGTIGNYELTYIKFNLNGVLPVGATIDNAIFYAIAQYGPSTSGTNYPPSEHIIETYSVDNDNWYEENITGLWAIQHNVMPNWGTWSDNENYISSSWLNDNVPAHHPNGYENENESPDGQWVWYHFNVGSIVASQWGATRDNVVTIALVPQQYYDNQHGGGPNSTLDSAGWFLAIQAWKNNYGPENYPYLKITYEPPPNGAVTESVTPTSGENLQGSTSYFNLTVTNTGTPTENYKIHLSDTGGWGLTLSGDSVTHPDENYFLNNMVSLENRVLTLAVKIPNGATIGYDDNITISIYGIVNGVENDLINANAMIDVRCTDNIILTGDDAWVNSGHPNDNTYGTSPLIVESFTQGDNQNIRTFLKFDLHNIADNQIITSAKIELYCYDAYGDDVDIQALGVDNDNWTEQKITWNTQPSFGPVLDTQTLSSFPVSSENSWYSWEVRDFVTSQRYLFNGTGDNLASFCLKASVENTNGEYRFFAHQYPSDNIKPRLEITFGSVKTRAVSTSISPVAKIGDIGSNRIMNFSVTAINKGNLKDNFTLASTADNTTGWTMTFDNANVNNLLPGYSVNRTLTVTIPTDAVQGYVNNVKVTATCQENTSVTDSENCSVAVAKASSWVIAGYSPDIENYGTAVVGAGNYIYVVTSNALQTRVNFMRYDPSAGGSWTYLATPAVSSPFKNGTVLAWDNSHYIYALGGGSYADNADNHRARHYFWRYNIDNNIWENRWPTGNDNNENTAAGQQGPGDALAIRIGTDNIYAIVGDKQKGSTFWVYSISANRWTQLSLPTTPDTWTSTDDGCSMVWTGGDNLYAFQGQSIQVDNRFCRYSISGGTWTKMADALAGVDDGGSLLWMGGDNIYALLGGNPTLENIRANCFYAYSRSVNSWTQLPNLPQGIADPTGPRMGKIGSNIYVWRGACNPTNEYNPVLWVYSLQTVYTVSLKLVPGWNLVGFPVISASPTPASVFPSLTYPDNYTVFYWKAPSGPYTIQGPSVPFNDNLGYWVYLNTSATATVGGTKPGNRTIIMVTGWNLVCFPIVSASTTPAGIFPGLIYPDDYSVFYWKAPSGPYTIQGPSVPFLDNTGYWVFLNVNRTVTVPV